MAVLVPNVRRFCLTEETDIDVNMSKDNLVAGPTGALERPGMPQQSYDSLP